jgi:hypothetical protein
MLQKHPEAKPFKNKGFAHYDRMTPIMQSHVKGKYAFRPSQQSYGAFVNPLPPQSSTSMLSQFLPPADPSHPKFKIIQGFFLILRTPSVRSMAHTSTAFLWQLIGEQQEITKEHSLKTA